MQTIVLEQPGHLRLTTTPAPAGPGPGEALLRVRRVGICGTDIHAFHGRQPFFSYPRILGHELAAEVMAIGPGVEQLAVGDRCAVEPYLNCGGCVACRRGRPNCCVSLQVIGVHRDGGMREYITMPAAKLHPSAQLSLEQLALVETLAIGAHAVERAAPEPGEPTLVIGAGPIGLAVMQFAHLAGAHVTAIDISTERLAFAAAQGIARQTMIAGDDIVAEVEALTGELPTTVIDATGSQASMERAFQLVANGGRLTFAGLVQGAISFSDPEFHRRELTLLATRNATPANFRRIIAQIEAGAIDTTPWVTHRAGPAELVERFSAWLRPGSGLLKGMLLLDG